MYQGCIQKWAKTRDAERAFRFLKKDFTEALILLNFNPQDPIILQTNASRLAITAILNQYDGFGILHAVNF
jgi:hypothetical protein